MSAVHTLVGTAHGSSLGKGGRPSKAGLDARQSELAFVAARMLGFVLSRISKLRHAGRRFGP